MQLKTAPWVQMVHLKKAILMNLRCDDDDDDDDGDAQTQLDTLQSKYQKRKLTYMFKFSKIFCGQLPTFSSDNVYNEFQQSYNNKDIRIELLIQFVTMVN